METCNVHDFVLSASALSSNSLDLSRKGIHELPEELPGCEKLECLYIEGNKLSTLPDSLFFCCCNLRWLDLRNNCLTTVPQSIEKLRSLKTLLLEGNQLTHLPPHLGRLTHLTGLNLSNNPLKSPPKHVIRKGTKAILQYLLNLLKDNGQSSIDKHVQYVHGHVHVDETDSTTGTSLRTADVTAHSPPKVSKHHVEAPSKLTLPLLSLKQVPLHAHVSFHYYGNEKNNKRSYLIPSSEQKMAMKNRRPRFKKSENKPLPQQLTAEEKLEINVTIDKKKAGERLDAWRDEARHLQGKQNVSVCINGPVRYQRAEEKAPFATSGAETKSQELLSLSLVASKLKIEEGALKCSSTDSLRDVREAEVRARVNKHMFELATMRKEAGLISSPSNELLEAERKLAQAIIRRRAVEREKSREYRLTAFTGDIN